MTKLSIQSENLALEWSTDPLAGELGGALGLIEVERDAGLLELEGLAGRGSGLAMMYLGHILRSGQYGTPIDKEAGREWLRKSTEAGSIEGGFRYAHVLYADNMSERAMSVLEGLSARGYAPASFVLGIAHYRAWDIPQNVTSALRYFTLAGKQGHLLGLQWQSSIYFLHSKNLLKWAAGILLRLKMAVPLAYYFSRRPLSDRVRTGCS
jgi:TPR repeat protein